MEVAKKFELEALEYLKNIFSVVDYIADRIPSSTYDFVAFKDGKIFYGDAKLSMNKPQLTPSQKDIDFIVTKNKLNEIKIYWKEDIMNKCIINKSTIIKIDERTKFQLDEIKIMPRESYDSVIQRLINKPTIKIEIDKEDRKI